MTTGAGKTKVRPWEQYRGTGDYPLFEPGWAGVVDDDELAFIQRTLEQDPALSFSWGFRPGQKTRSAVGIRRVAEHGDSDNRPHNRSLARQRMEKPFPETEGPVSATIKKSGAGVTVSTSPRQLELAFV